MSLSLCSRRTFVASFGFIICGRTVRADGAHAGFAIIEHNPRAGTLEIIHRLMALDLELALTARLGRVVQLDKDGDIEAVLEDYLHEYFSIQSGDGKDLTVNWVGFEQIGSSAIVYQEAPWSGEHQELMIYNQILTDAHPTQVNTVNVTFGKTTQTRMFTADDEAQSVTQPSK
jgi:hypothetical protein